MSSATEQTTRARVNERTLVLAPCSSECSAASFGPCDLNAVELSDSALQSIELDGTAPAPRLLAAPHERDPGLGRVLVLLAATVLACLITALFKPALNTLEERLGVLGWTLSPVDEVAR